MTDPITDNPIARQRAAGAFLRSRRGRLAPSDVGLSTGLRRRTPGLRREEVAMLAGVGTTWYTWLEQGREIQPSNDVLSALAEALRLDPAERHHLFVLYDRPTPDRRLKGQEHVGEPLRQMVDGLTGQPAFVLGRRWDILTWNRAAELVIGPYLGRSGGKPNVLELMFSDSARRLFVDWEAVARGAIATFRADCVQDIGDLSLEAMVERLTRLSAEFAEWWPQYDVAQRMAGTKRLDHPTVGRMHFAFSMLAVGDTPGMKLLVFTAIDEDDTRRRLSLLLEPPHRVAEPSLHSCAARPADAELNAGLVPDS